MSRSTKLTSIDDMFEAGGFKVDSEADFEKISESELDAFVKSTTRFSTWKEMQEKESPEWITKKLGPLLWIDDIDSQHFAEFR
jgi:hypothetical protein